MQLVHAESQKFIMYVKNMAAVMAKGEIAWAGQTVQKWEHIAVVNHVLMLSSLIVVYAKKMMAAAVARERAWVR